MTPDEYTKWCRRFDNHVPETRMLALALGLASEAGEVAGEFEERLRVGAAELDLDAVKKELGDVLWNVTRLADELNWTLEDLMNHNVNKLIGRYTDRGLEIK